jgi:uncharacterized lipoprotein YmbA
MNIEKETKMKNLFIPVLAILTLFALLTIHFGCASSPPSRFYLLSPLETTPPGMKPSADEQCVSIGIGPVKIPDYLNQTKIVTRGEGNQLTLAEFDRWAELLKDNLVSVLAKNLSNLLCTKSIVLFPWRGGMPIDYRIEMEVLRLDGNLGGNVSLEAWWMIFSGDGKKMVFSKKSTFTEAITGKDYDSLVSAESRTVGLLSSEIAQAIKTLPK